ncbi:hypothetical protein IQ07DRAFT_598703 [Pyrenochaeta sp. DS3sAY3a]|nr:hypothetical protein IQ07DRAFT_598703 [Pyrenochaeta sp. DS3sAY3a]
MRIRGRRDQDVEVNGRERHGVSSRRVAMVARKVDIQGRVSEGRGGCEEDPGRGDRPWSRHGSSRDGSGAEVQRCGRAASRKVQADEMRDRRSRRRGGSAECERRVDEEVEASRRGRGAVGGFVVFWSSRGGPCTRRHKLQPTTATRTPARASLTLQRRRAQAAGTRQGVRGSGRGSWLAAAASPNLSQLRALEQHTAPARAARHSAVQPGGLFCSLPSGPRAKRPACSETPIACGLAYTLHSNTSRTYWSACAPFPVTPSSPTDVR